MTIPRIIISVRGGVAEVEAADRPVDVAIIDFDMEGSFAPGVLTAIEGEEAGASIFEIRPNPNEIPGPRGKTFDQLWAEAEEATRWWEREGDNEYD